MEENSSYNNLINSDPESSCSSTKLYSSQPKADVFVPSVEVETGVNRSSTTDRPTIPPRNYQNAPPNALNAMNSYNRYAYPSQRFPFNSGGYSYGYGSSYPWSYNSVPYGGHAMNGYNFSNSNESRFIRAAEERARPTFQAIESLTRALNSVAFMMESTFGSLNMSFQAILSVIENFSHARTLLKQFAASILTLRIFHKCLLIIMNLLRKMNIISETFATRFTTLDSRLPVENSSSLGISMWPIVSFLGLVLGAPYLISKMLPREEIAGKKAEWNPNADNFVSLVGVHDFQAANTQEISFRRGQKLKMIPPEIMQPSSPYWVFVADENDQTGYVPRNHVAPA